MTYSEPGAILLKGVKTAWDANATLAAEFSSRVYRDQMPAGQSTYPYVVVSCSVEPDGWSCDSQHYVIRVDFEVYHKSPEEASASLSKVIDVFGNESFEIGLDVGSIYSKMEGRPRTSKVDHKVHMASQEYVFRTNKPRSK